MYVAWEAFTVHIGDGEGHFIFITLLCSALCIENKPLFL